MKKCPNCGKELDDNTVVCPECNTSLETEAPDNQNAQSQEAEESEIQSGETVTEQPKKKNTKKAVAAVALVAVLGIGGFEMYNAKVKKETYQAGIEALQSEDYALAEELFAKIPGYKDVASYQKVIADQKVYEQALGLYEAENYDEAEKLFEEIASYKDAQTYLTSIHDIRAYNEAYALYQEGEYKAALQIIDGITLYEPAEQLRHTMESEIAYNAYQGDFNAYSLKAQAAQVAAEDSISRVMTIWYNCIYTKDDEATDPYTKDDAGEFYADFNDALRRYYLSEEYEAVEANLKEAADAASQAFAKLDKAPEELKDVYGFASEVEEALSAYIHYAENISGTYTGVVEGSGAAYQSFAEAFASFKSSIPAKKVISAAKEQTNVLESREVLLAKSAQQEEPVLLPLGEEASEAETEDITEGADDLESVADQAGMADEATESESELPEEALTEGVTAESNETEALSETIGLYLIEEQSEALTEQVEEGGETVEEMPEGAAMTEITTEEAISEAEELFSEAMSEAHDEFLEAMSEAQARFDERMSEAENRFQERMSEAVTEAPAEAITEAVTEAPAEAVTEAVAEETVTEAAAEEAVTEAAAEEAVTEAVTEAAAEEAVEAVTEEAAEAVTEEVTEALESVAEVAEGILPDEEMEEETETETEIETEKKPLTLAIAGAGDETETESITDVIGEWMSEIEQKTETLLTELSTEGVKRIGKELEPETESGKKRITLAIAGKN